MGRKLIPYLLLFFLVLSILPLEKVDSPEEPETGIIGNPTIPQPRNWTRFWRLFNTYSEWDLEYNNGTGWISDRSQLQIIRNYTERIEGENGFFYIPSDATYGDSVKITLNFTALYTADYRLTFAINLDVRNYTHRTGSWNYTLSYQNYTVFFDWTDIRDLPLDNVAHGIMPVGDESYFWFRIRRNNIPEGTNIVIDPIFGNNQIGGSGYGSWGNRVNVCNFTLTESGTVSNVTIYIADAGENEGICGVIYDISGFTPNNLMVEGANTTVTGVGWLDLPASVHLSAGNYFIGASSISPTGGSITYRYDAGNANQTQRSNADPQPSDDPWAGTANFYAYNLSVYATYTPDAGQDLTFNLFENFNIWDYMSRGLVLSRSTYENIQILSSSSRGIELGRNLFENFRMYGTAIELIELSVLDLYFTLFENVRIYSSALVGRELSQSLFENIRIYGTTIELIEITVLDLYFSLFENVQMYARATVGRELAFSLFDNVQLWSSITSTFEGIAIDLSFTLFESVRVWAGLSEIIVSPYTVNDALLLAGFAVILAFVAIGLVFLVRKES